MITDIEKNMEYGNTDTEAVERLAEDVANLILEQIFPKESKR